VIPKVMIFVKIRIAIHDTTSISLFPCQSWKKTVANRRLELKMILIPKIKRQAVISFKKLKQNPDKKYQ